MAAFGAPADVISQTLDVETDDDAGDLEIWEDNWATVEVFLSLNTQWRREIPAMSDRMIWHGLPYPAIESTIRMMGRWKQAADIFDGLRVMEAAALKILNK